MALSRRTKSGRGIAWAVAVCFGVVTPTIGNIFGSHINWLGEHSLYTILGISFAAYTTHMFLFNSWAHKRLQWGAFAITVLLGVTYSLWLGLIADVLKDFANSWGSGLPAGVRGNFELGMVALYTATGTIMALCLWRMTLSVWIGVVAFGTSLICGLLVARTVGLSSILWNAAIAFSLLAWAFRVQDKQLANSTTACNECGYSLIGLIASPNGRVCCPECGLVSERSLPQTAD